MAVSATIPIVGAIAAGVLGIVELFKHLFHGPSPYDAIDSGHVESGSAACYDIWLLVSGEAIAGAGDPKTWKPCGSSQSYVNVTTWPNRVSAYPNVPNGPLGDQSVDIDQALSGVQQIIDQVSGQMGGAPGVAYSNGSAAKHLQQSLSNPFFTTGGGLGHTGEVSPTALLQKVQAARTAAGVVAGSTSPTASAIVSEISSNPTAVIVGLALLGLAVWSFE
jgi:hypothetical protein